VKGSIQHVHVLIGDEMDQQGVLTKKEEVVQEASKEEAKDPNVFKDNRLCVMEGVVEG
jgi:hypothetical protein